MIRELRRFRNALRINDRPLQSFKRAIVILLLIEIPVRFTRDDGALDPDPMQNYVEFFDKKRISS